MENIKQEDIEKEIYLDKDFDDIARRMTLMQSYRESANFLHITSHKILHDMTAEIKKKYGVDISRKQITLNMANKNLVIFKDPPLPSPPNDPSKEIFITGKK